MSTPSILELVAWIISGRSRQELEMTAVSGGDPGAWSRGGDESHFLLFVLLHLWPSPLN